MRNVEGNADGRAASEFQWAFANSRNKEMFLVSTRMSQTMLKEFVMESNGMWIDRGKKQQGVCNEREPSNQTYFCDEI